jgi:hypothetical protein
MKMEDFEIFVEDFLDMLNGQEASIVKMKQQIAKLVGVAQEKQKERVRTWDPAKIKWVQAQGTSGPYERHPPEGEKAEATEDYKCMLQDLKEHNGKLSRKEADGATWFYWVFQDGATVGRKKHGGKPSGKPESTERAQLNKIKAAFPEDLQPLLTFEVQGEICVIKARQFLGTENFAKIASVVRGLGGQYVSEGKNSRFELPLSK